MSRILARVGTVAILIGLAACSGEVALPIAQANVAQTNVITGNVVRLDGSASKDPQGRQLFFEWSFASLPAGSAATLIDANQMLPDFTADVAGDYVVQLVVSNGVVKSSPVTVTVHVTLCGFASPTVAIQGPNNIPVISGNTANLSVLASDPDNQCLPATAQQTITIEWQVTSRPPNSSAVVSDPASAAPSLTTDAPGNYQLRVVATDSTHRSSAPAFVTVVASACGLVAPKVSFANPVVPGTTGTPVNLAAIADNAQNCRSANNAFAFAWSLTERPAGSQAFLPNPTATAPSFTPDLAGAYQVQVIVTDTSVGISSAPATETVNVARAACGFAAPQIVNAHGTPALPSPGTTVTLSATATDKDNDPAGCNLGQALHFSWTPTSAPSGSLATLSDASAAAPTFVADVAGTYAFSVVATDSDGLSSPPAGVIVQTAACAPALAAFTPISTIIGTAANLVAPTPTDTCVANPAFTYRWTLTSRPAASSAVLSGASSPNASFTPDVIGDYQAQLVVTDQGNFSSAPTAITIHAATCGAAPPALTNLAATPTTPNVGDTTAFSVTVTDVNGTSCNGISVTPFQYSWSLVSKPHGSAASLALATSASPVLVPDVAGGYQVSVVVTDALGNASDPAFTTLTTTNCGFFAPVAAITLPAISPFATNSNTFVGLAAAATSSDNTSCPAQFHDTFTFSWSIVASPAASRLTSSSGASTSFIASGPGSYVVQVVATASNGLSSAPAFQTINVAACGSASPIIVATANAPAFPAPTQDVSLSATATDADAACGFPPAPGVTWSIYSLPQGSATILQNPGGAAHFVPDIEGTYVFRAVATDSTGLSSEPAFVSIEALNPDPNTSTVTVLGGLTTLQVVADNLDAGTITATIKNAHGNPIAQLPVQVFSSGLSNTFAPVGGAGLTDVNGTFIASMVSKKAELKTFTVIANPALAAVTLTANPTLDYVAGPTASILIAGLPPSVTAGDLSTVTVTAFDQFANVAKGPNAYTGTVHFTKSDGNAAAAVPGDFTFSPGDDGTHTFVNAVKLVTAGTQSVTATDTVHLLFTSTQSTTVNSGPAASIALTGTPTPTTAGVAFSVTVTAHDQFGNVATGPNAYTGTVHFTKSDGGTGSVVPADFAFAPTDHGTHAFTNGVTLVTAGSQTVTVTDTVTNTFTSSQTTTVNSAQAASITLSGAPASTTAGVAFTVTVTAHDQFNNVATGPNGYTGTVHFTKSDGGAGSAVPVDFGFALTDHGTHTFTNGVTLVTAGSRTVTATDTVNNTLTSSQTVTVTAAAPATAAFVQQPTTTVAGAAITPAVTVNVQDAFANNVPNAGVTLAIGVNAGGGTLTGGGAQTTSSGGIATFAALSIDKTGTGYTLHASVTSTTVTADSTTFDIIPAAPATATFTQQPTTATAGVAISPAVTVNVQDALSNNVPGVNVTLTIATGFNPGGGTLTGGGAQTTDTNGVATFPGLSINKSGTGYKLTATVASSTVTVASSTFDITAAAPATATFTQQPADAEAGAAITAAVHVVDAFTNDVTGASVTLTIAAGSPTGGTLSGGGAQTTNGSGVATFSGLSIDKAATGYKLHAAVASTSVTVDSTAFSITPATAATLTVAVASPAASGVASDVTVTAFDAFNNVATGYAGTVHFTSGDGAATVPTDSTLANGTKTFTGAGGVTFNTVGAQTLTATDTVTNTITGTVSVTVNAWFSTTNNNLSSRRLTVDGLTKNIYAATNGGGVYTSADHGATWTAATTPPTDLNVEDVSAAPVSFLYAATSTGGVFLSTDDGATWSAANGTGLTALADLNTTSIAADPSAASGETVYVATGTDVFVTTTGASTQAWAQTNFTATTDTATALAITPTGSVFAGGATGQVYVLGTTGWTSLALTNTQQIDSLAVNGANLFAGTHDGHVFMFDINTTTWNAGVTAGTNPLFQIAFADASVGYAASAGGGVFKTTDGGATTNWTAANTGITQLNVRGVAVDGTTTTTVFAGTDGSGFFKTVSAGQ